MNNSERDELLVRVDERVGTIHERLEKGDERMADQGKRIKKLELWRTSVVAGIAVLLFVLTLAIRLA